MAIDYQSQLLSTGNLTSGNWDTTAVEIGKIRIINKLMISNGNAAGALAISLYDSANTQYVELANINIPAYPVDLADYVQFYDFCTLKEGDYLRFTPATSNDITVHLNYSEK